MYLHFAKQVFIFDKRYLPCTIVIQPANKNKAPRRLALRRLTVMLLLKIGFFYASNSLQLLTRTKRRKLLSFDIKMSGVQSL